MDLTRLYNMTTPELREHAERLGVGDTYAMSRGQLIQAIRDKSAPSRPEGLLGKVFGFAKWAIQAAGETRASPPPEASAPARAPRPVALAVDEPEPEPEAEPEAEPKPEPDDERAREPEPVASAKVDPEPPAPSRAPAGVFANRASSFDEPFPTRTMARILADQGHFKRSLAIYGRLLDEEPDDGELVAEAEAVRAEANARRSHAPS